MNMSIRDPQNTSKRIREDPDQHQLLFHYPQTNSTTVIDMTTDELFELIRLASYRLQGRHHDT